MLSTDVITLKMVCAVAGYRIYALWVHSSTMSHHDLTTAFFIIICVV